MAVPKPPPMTHARLRAFELRGVAERPGEVPEGVAGLQPREAHGGGADCLEDDGDGAGLRVAVVHGERNAFAFFVDTQHDELAGLDLP